ncbi:MAG TPA: ABC transporter substrate-binding protein [Casimicrobiaceae bacterium]
MTAALLGAPLSALAQTAQHVSRIAYLSAFSQTGADAFLNDLREELRKLGWIDGKNALLLEPRAADNRHDRLPTLAIEVVGLKPDVIAVRGAPATRILKERTSVIPIVMVGVGDPVTFGLIDSLARPGRNVTGTAALEGEVETKVLDLLHEAAPRASSVAVFVNPNNEGAAPYARTAREAGSKRGLRVQVLEVRSTGDFDSAFAAIAGERTESILVATEGLIQSQRKRIAEFALRHGLPCVVHVTGGLPPDSGELLTYGPVGSEYPRLTASYIDRILKGAKPADLPVEQLAKFNLIINLKTATALGLTIPQSLVLRAHEVIR